MMPCTSRIGAEALRMHGRAAPLLVSDGARRPGCGTACVPAAPPVAHPMAHPNAVRTRTTMTPNTLAQPGSAADVRTDDRSTDPTDDGAAARPSRRGPHALVALGGFAALVATAVGVILALVTLGRLLDRVI